MKAKARAHANIALIKYWGKADEALIIPNNSSLSLTLDAFYTDTHVHFDEHLAEDEFILDGKSDPKTLVKISKFADLFRAIKGINTRVRVKSVNHVPTAAGLASSASGFAALGVAINAALDLNMDAEVLSTYIRQGSGSATRSVYGGLVEWQKGSNTTDSKAVFIDDATFDLGMVIVVIDKDEKTISSRVGMQHTIETSPYYTLWAKDSARDLEAMKEAISNKDIDHIGSIAEHNALKMHATMMSANPAIIYMQPDSLKAIQMVQAMRNEGLTAFITMDAGPNVKIVCKLSESDQIVSRLKTTFKDEQIIVSGPGPDAYVLEE